MALPQLNDVPMYTMTVPSTGKQVKYRPFLVKEQKVLMLASESQDRKQMLTAMLNTIESCVTGISDIEKLPTFDIDYLFTQIRAKSVGEKTSLLTKCSKCDAEVEFSVDLSNLNVPEVKNKHSIIKLTDTVSVRMTYPSYNLIMENSKDEDVEEVSAEFIMGFVMNCIESIQTAEENILMRDESYDEKIRFLESLNTEQFEKLATFVKNMPKLFHDANLKCGSCGHEEVKRLEGIESFF